MNQPTHEFICTADQDPRFRCRASRRDALITGDPSSKDTWLIRGKSLIPERIDPRALRPARSHLVTEVCIAVKQTSAMKKFTFDAHHPKNTYQQVKHYTEWLNAWLHVDKTLDKEERMSAKTYRNDLGAWLQRTNPHFRARRPSILDTRTDIGRRLGSGVSPGLMKGADGGLPTVGEVLQTLAGSIATLETQVLALERQLANKED